MDERPAALAGEG